MIICLSPFCLCDVIDVYIDNRMLSLYCSFYAAINPIADQNNMASGTSGAVG